MWIDRKEHEVEWPKATREVGCREGNFQVKVQGLMHFYCEKLLVATGQKVDRGTYSTLWGWRCKMDGEVENLSEGSTPQLRVPKPLIPYVRHCWWATASNRPTGQRRERTRRKDFTCGGKIWNDSENTRDEQVSGQNVVGIRAENGVVVCFRSYSARHGKSDGSRKSAISDSAELIGFS